MKKLIDQKINRKYTVPCGPIKIEPRKMENGKFSKEAKWVRR